MDGPRPRSRLSPDGSTLPSCARAWASRHPTAILYETAGYIATCGCRRRTRAFMDHQTLRRSRWVRWWTVRAVTTLAGEFSGEEGVAWTPDGSNVRFAANDGTAKAGSVLYQILSVPARGSAAVERVLTSPGDFYVHDIAPDGRWLATREDSRLGVVARGVDSTVERDLTWLDLSWFPRLSPDGRRVLFSDGHAGGNYGVVWRNTDGSPVVRLGDGNVLGFSPDGAFALANVFTPPGLVLYPLGAGEPVRLERGPIVSTGDGLWPRRQEHRLHGERAVASAARIDRTSPGCASPSWRPHVAAAMSPTARRSSDRMRAAPGSHPVSARRRVWAGPDHGRYGRLLGPRGRCRPAGTEVPARLNESIPSREPGRRQELAPADRAGLIQVRLFVSPRDRRASLPHEAATLFVSRAEVRADYMGRMGQTGGPSRCSSARMRMS